MKNDTTTYSRLPSPSAIVARKVHVETRKALDANAPDDRWVVTTTTYETGRVNVTCEIVR